MDSELEAHYRAVCEHPGDDTVRLAFADHAEEAGDAVWSQFIRDQFELDAMGPPPLRVGGEVVPDGPRRFHLTGSSDDQTAEGDTVTFDGTLRGVPFKADMRVVRKTVDDPALGTTRLTLELAHRSFDLERYKKLTASVKGALEGRGGAWTEKAGGWYTAWGTGSHAVTREYRIPGHNELVIFSFVKGFVSALGCSGGLWAANGDAWCRHLPLRRVSLADPPTVKHAGSFDVRYYKILVGGKVVQVSRDAWHRTQSPREMWEIVLAARWPSVPAGGWSLLSVPGRIETRYYEQMTGMTPDEIRRNLGLPTPTPPE